MTGQIMTCSDVMASFSFFLLCTRDLRRANSSSAIDFRVRQTTIEQTSIKRISKMNAFILTSHFGFRDAAIHHEKPGQAARAP
jgi:hypothetical protein